MVTSPPGFDITTPKHETLPPKEVVLAPVTVDSQVAAVVEVGTALVQLPQAFKLVVLFALTFGAAETTIS
jgi:hypothetical protein